MASEAKRSRLTCRLVLDCVVACSSRRRDCATALQRPDHAKAVAGDGVLPAGLARVSSFRERVIRIIERADGADICAIAPAKQKLAADERYASGLRPALPAILRAGTILPDKLPQKLPQCRFRAVPGEVRHL